MRLTRPNAMLAASCICTAFATAAGAQSSAQRQEGSVRVQSSVNFFLPGPTNESEEAHRLRDRAKRIVYDIAGGECDRLREALAKDCRLESINSNVQAQRSGQAEGYNVNGQLGLVITLK